MRIKYKTKKNLTRVLSIVLICLAVFGAACGISTMRGKGDDGKHTINPTFAVGGLNAQGKYFETDESIYTAKAFECEGLEIKLRFDADITYQVFYYNELDNFVSCSTVYTKSAKAVAPNDAEYARLVVTPVWDSEVDLENRVCHWYDIYKYSSQIEVIVSDASEEDVNLADVLAYTKSGDTYTFERAAVRGYDVIEVHGAADGTLKVTYYDESNQKVGSEETITVSNGSVNTLAIPAAAYKVEIALTSGVSGLDGAVICLRKYK